MGKAGKHLRKSGAYSNGRYGQFRYGEDLTNPDGTVRQVYDPSRRTKARALPKERRREIEQAATAVIGRWSWSPFQHEANVRTGLRSGLCLEGFGWEPADKIAGEVTAEALLNIGAQRPSWAEGQWAYAIGHDNCANCYRPIEGTDQVSGYRFCSPMCAHSYAGRHEAETLRRNDEMIRNAQRMVRDYKAPLVTCDHCGRDFRSAAKHAASYAARQTKHTYCSVECSDAAKRTIPDRECKWCSKTFHPASSEHEHCSKECAVKTAARVRWVEQVAARAPRTCEGCGSEFRPRQEDSRFCCRQCAMRAYRSAHKAWTAGILTPATFDRQWAEAA